MDRGGATEDKQVIKSNGHWKTIKIMNIKVSFTALLLCVLLCSLSGCSSKELALSKNDSQKVDSLIKVHKVNDRTIIVSFGHDAVTAIKTKHGIVVVDAGISTELTSKYKKTIEDNFLQDDYKYVINTHGHHDHIRGNSIFSQAEVVGHENCRMEASDRRTSPEESMMSLWKIAEDYEQRLEKAVPNTSEWDDVFTQKIRYMSAFFDAKNHISVRLPDITFSDTMKLDLGDTTFEMIHFGKFHSNSDILIYVPEIRTIFTGDLFSKFGRSGISDSSSIDTTGCMRAINWIDNRIYNIETVIEGHGQILSGSDLKDFTDNISNRCPGE
ncbi:MBL fold metallo-hydrolase [bacterium]|nr:MBL fold metallo-hydrolase [bacterium]